MDFDLVVIGSGPGGYVAAVRAAQLGMKVALIEKENLGGVCLNWGCIPTKSLIKCAHVYEELQHASYYGIEISGEIKVDFPRMVERSREVAQAMQKGVQFLMKKNKITVYEGTGSLDSQHCVAIETNNGEQQKITAQHILLATGARSRDLPMLPKDGKRIIGYREAMTLPQQPKSMIVVGSGAIGSEFAYFYQTIGTQVTLVEFMPNVLPNADEEVSKTLARCFKKAKMEVMLDASVESVDLSGENCKVSIKTKKGTEIREAEVVFSAVGITPNVENIGLENAGVLLERGKVKVDKWYQTNIEGIYAIGDLINTPALAHVASAEAIVCIEKMMGHDINPIDYGNIPNCVYTNPESSSVGLTEKQALDMGYEIKIAKSLYMASGKANANGNRDGFVKLIINSENGNLLGAHLIGDQATELISELAVARTLNVPYTQLADIIHPHPTMSEAIVDAIKSINE